MDLPVSVESTASLRSGLRRTGWTTNQLWIAAIGIGGQLLHEDIEDIAAGARPATPAEHDVLAAALNDYFVDHGQDHPIASWRQLEDDQPR